MKNTSNRYIDSITLLFLFFCVLFDAGIIMCSADDRLNPYANQIPIDTFQLTDTTDQPSDDLTDKIIEDLFEKCIINYAAIEDYTCILHKVERIDDELIEEKNIVYKFRKPLSVYLGFPSGSEAIYSQGKYDDKLKFHSGNIFSFIVFSLDPRGDLAMDDNRHSILESHIGHIISIINTNYIRAKKNNELKTNIVGSEIIKGRETTLFRSILPENKGYFGHLIIINMDKKLYMPVKIEVYGWHMELLEAYQFSDLKINVGLTDLDFDINNPDYDF